MNNREYSVNCIALSNSIGFHRNCFPQSENKSPFPQPLHTWNKKKLETKKM